jgi:hypothetical protein
VTHLLLTGAGFSRNWGGWLADEAFEYLLGRDHIDDSLRRQLWAGKERGMGFEDILAQAQGAYQQQPYGQPEEQLRHLTNAIIAMFGDMALGYANTNFEFQNGIEMMVKTFLQRFDAIYTLNQDDLLERHYLPSVIGGRFNGAYVPGVRPHTEPFIMGGQQFQTFKPDESQFQTPSGLQPYYKLHGSFNWIGGAREIMLILGGNKAANIDQYANLVWYFNQFRADLARPDARLMIIGYSFSDPHINAIIETAINTGLKLFIIDPLGVNVIDKRNPQAQIRERQSAFMEKICPSVIGASRRPLSELVPVV